MGARIVNSAGLAPSSGETMTLAVGPAVACPSDMTTLAALKTSPRRGVSSHHGPSATRSLLAQTRPFHTRALSGRTTTASLAVELDPPPGAHAVVSIAGATRIGRLPRLYTVNVSAALSPVPTSARSTSAST